jgi:RNA polymerase sigma-70 factor (ECF subfamily)
MAGARTDARDDAAIVERVLRGDAEAFGVLVTRYRTAYERCAVGLCGDADLAADAMQEAFIRAYDALATCDRPDRFGAWFYRILRNQCHNHRARRHPSVPLDEVDAVAPGGTADRLERAELREQLEAALARLPETQREAMLLRHVQGLSYGEMADLLGEREDRLRMRVHRARDAMRQQLEGAHA